MFEVEALFPHTEGDVERQQLGPLAGFLLLHAGAWRNYMHQFIAPVTALIPSLSFIA